ncbi:hypothetical protein [uncultured Paracoccus sp.]|uniref:zinc finger domain-containing protein n=1 Tax=uncultured Paracoccus sp. TaxID=189685 RepID=UPI002634265E|nr:hypothetical protein [uncultured Paracoccus sp.]
MTVKTAQPDYDAEKSWHGLSCACGGGYRVGHALGCEWATAADNLAAILVDLARADANGDVQEVADLRRIKAGIEALDAPDLQQRQATMMTILRARDIAEAMAAHSEADRRAAFAALHASADLNKDQRRAAADRVLAQAIWDSFGHTPAADFTAYRHPVLAVPCPTCAAAAGAWCRRPSGHKAAQLHNERRADADSAFILQHGTFAAIRRDGTAWIIDAHGRARD